VQKNVVSMPSPNWPTLELLSAMPGAQLTWLERSSSRVKKKQEWIPRFTLGYTFVAIISYRIKLNKNCSFPLSVLPIESHMRVCVTIYVNFPPSFHQFKLLATIMHEVSVNISAILGIITMCCSSFDKQHS
jgi:hypothetical protein